MIDLPIRVLVVDDSAVVRGLLARALDTQPGIEVSGTAIHGEAALNWMMNHPVDVVVLDVEMPVMDGLQTLLNIQAEFDGVQVIMASALTYEGAETTVRALASGAAGCIAKPRAASVHESINQLVTELVPLVKALGRRQAAEPTPTAVSPTVARTVAAPPRILVIGASTGGPQALTTVLTGLPRDFPLPICIVQHMPPLFTPMLAKHLAKDTGRPCAEAQNGEPVQPGHTYIAPGDFHVSLARSETHVMLTLNQRPPEHYCRPSVNPLFRSAARCYAKAVLAVMLTGMGEDGIEGSRTIVEEEGYLIAQDEATSVVWGMPGAVVRANLAHEVLPLDQIAGRVSQICLESVSNRS